MEETAGEYYLSGVHEMASGFLLKENGEFEFFFSYGALDRYGKGVWKKENGQLLLSSREEPSPGFKLNKSGTGEEGQMRIKIAVENPVLRSSVLCSVNKGDAQSWVQTDKNGELILPQSGADTIYFILDFCPEKITSIQIPGKSHTDFEFTMEPSIMEVHFDNFMLAINNGNLFGHHPLLQGDQFIYQKT